MSAPRCLMIIDAEPVVRAGIRHELGGGWGYEELPHGADAPAVLRDVGFEVAIVEMRPADDGAPSGAATIRELLDQEPSLGVIGHGGGVERHALAEALDAGATAYVSKRSPTTTIGDAIAAVAELESFVDPSIDRRGRGKPPITRRQRQILQFFADGLTTEQAAERLGLSSETIRTHAKAALPRLGASDRAHAIAIALRAGLIA